MKKVKKQLLEWEKTFVNYISDKDLASRIYTELLELNNINGQSIWVNNSPKKIYKQPVSPWKLLNIISHQGNANQNHSEIPLITH